MTRRTIGWLLTAGLAAPASAGEHGHATVKHRFPGVERAEEMYEAKDRDSWQKPEEVVKALALRPGDRVADLGAGTGYFAAHLARAVGERGAVFALEVEPDLVAHLRARAEKEKTENVTPVLASFDNPRLPAGAIDLVLVVDTYHHIDRRREYFTRLKGVLREGGRVAVLDFEKRELPVGPKELSHKLDRAEVEREMKEAGYQLTQDLDEMLPYQYLLVFRPQ